MMESVESPKTTRNGCCYSCPKSGIFLGEMKRLCKYAIPITITQALESLMSIICVIFVGALGDKEIAALGLALSIFSATGFSLMHGLLSTCVTVFSQTFGSGNKFQMGIELQKALYITSISCTCIWGIFLSAEPILLAIKINPLIAKMVAEYLVYMIPATLFVSTYNVLEKYIQSQNKLVPPMIIWGLTNMTNATFHYILLFRLKIGIKGSAIAQSISYLCAAILMIIYVSFSKISRTTWSGYSRAMWYDWSNWVKLGIPGLAMIALKWWFYEIGLLLVGTVGITELVAQTLLNNIKRILYNLLSVGLGIACSIVVGQGLGAGDASIPPVAIMTGLSITCSGMTLAAILLTALRWHLPKIFTNDRNVIAVTAECLPLLGVFLVFEGAVGVLGGAIRGAGLQPFGAVTIFTCLYIISAPLGFTLLLKSELKLKGLWIGFSTGVFLMSAVYLILLLRTNWHKQIEEAAKRTKKKITEPVDNSDDSFKSFKISVKDGDDSDSDLYEKSMDAAVATNKGCMILSRCLFTAGMTSIFLVGLIIKLTLPLSQIFGTACLRGNGTFIWIPDKINTSNPFSLEIFASNENCTIFTP